MRQSVKQKRVLADANIEFDETKKGYGFLLYHMVDHSLVLVRMGLGMVRKGWAIRGRKPILLQSPAGRKNPTARFGGRGKNTISAGFPAHRRARKPALKKIPAPGGEEQFTARFGEQTPTKPSR